jgi:hypothetical protein
MAAFTDVSEASIIRAIASISETSVNFYQTTRRNIPEDSYLHTRRRENLKSLHPLLLSSYCTHTINISVQ